MVMRANTKALLRLFKKHLARLITIVAIVIVSIGFMSGIGEVENKIKVALNEYYEQYRTSDLYIKSKNDHGFSLEEQALLTEKYGEKNLETAFCYEIEQDGEISRIYTLDLSANTINRLKIQSGRLPERENEIVAERKTPHLNGYSLGDKVLLNEREYVVCGIAYNPLMITKLEEPSFQYAGQGLSNIFYLHAGALPMVNEVYVTIDDRALFDAFSDKYEERILKEKSEISALMGAENVSALSLYENYGLYSLFSYAEKVGMIGIIFVVFFLLVTLLIVYATMTRLFDEERALIACQKTLGYSDGTIVKKYLFFVAIATFVGGLLAYPVGVGLTNVIYVAFDLQYVMPPFPHALTFTYYLCTFAIIFVATTLLTLLSGLHTVKNKPATLLTPKAPKSGKKVFLEKIPFLWNRLSFKYKSTFRNVFLFKSRFFMTVVSVIGSSVLVFAGLGLLDCSSKIENASSIALVSVALVVFSAALCALVIYNLTNINVSERTREIATLMVLGYHDNEVSGYIFREIYIMSFIGAILGIPVGVIFLDFAFGIINFGAIAEINWWTYLLAPCITMTFSFLSTLWLKKRITKTDMNASLKTIE